MNLYDQLAQSLEGNKYPSIQDQIVLDGVAFPTKLTKRFLSTFKNSNEVHVFVAEEDLRFKWNNGYAHINSVQKIEKLKNAKKCSITGKPI